MNAPFNALEKVLRNYCSRPFLSTLVNCIHMFFFFFFKERNFSSLDVDQIPHEKKQCVPAVG